VNIRDPVYEQVKAVADQQRKTLPQLTDEVRLLDDGLDSLACAILIANLDEELNLDPFASNTAGVPVTIGDLIRVYEQAAASGAVYGAC
jgi:acyl carrier protein